MVPVWRLELGQSTVCYAEDRKSIQDQGKIFVLDFPFKSKEICKANLDII